MIGPRAKPEAPSLYAAGNEGVPSPTARDLFDWNGCMPNTRIVEEEDHGVTPTFMVVADYGWAEWILCGGCYLQDALAICQAIREACAS